MPARIIGMIGVTPPKQESTLLVIEGEISPPFVVEFAQAHEAAGFDMALVGASGRGEREAVTHVQFCRRSTRQSPSATSANRIRSRHLHITQDFRNGYGKSVGIACRLHGCDARFRMF